MDNLNKFAILQRAEKTALLFAILLLLIMLYILLLEWMGSRHAGRLVESGYPTLVVKKPQPIDHYLNTLSRREMFKASVLYETKKPETVSVLGDLVYLGAIREKGVPRAFIMNNKSKQSSIYGKGESIDDLQITDIADDRVTFQHGSETLQLVR
jgi:hypothetical protein